MSEWNKVNNRILIIGKFSQEPGFDNGAVLASKSFIDEIKPGYYREYTDDAISFDGGSGAFGGFKFARPSESHKKDAVFVPISADSPLLKLATANNTVVEWAKDAGKAAYATLYERLKDYQQTISEEDFCSRLLDSAKTYVENNIGKKTDDSVTATISNDIVNTNVSVVMTYLFSANSGVPTLKYDNSIAATRVAKCLRDFKVTGNFAHFYTLLNEICVFLADPMNIPAILLWMITERGEHIDKLGCICDTAGLHKVSKGEFLKIDPKKIKVDYEAISGQTFAELTDPQKEIDAIKNETVKTTAIMFAGEARSESMAALQLSAAYSRRTFQKELVGNYSAASVVVSKAGEKVLRAIKAFAEKVLKNPNFSELAATYWNQGECIIEEENLKKLAAVLGKEYKEVDWEDFLAADVASQVGLFFKKYREGLVSKMETPVTQNLNELIKTRIKSDIIFEAILYSGSPQGTGYGLMPLPTSLSTKVLEDTSAHNWLNSYYVNHVTVIKEKVMQVVKDAATDIQMELLELQKAGAIQLSGITVSLEQSGGNRNFPLLYELPQKSTDEQLEEKEETEGGEDKTGELLEQGLIPLYTPGENGTGIKIVFQDHDGKKIDWEQDYGKSEINSAIAKIETCYEVAKDDKTLLEKSKEWYSDSFQLISGRNDKGKEIPNGIEKYALPILLGNIIGTLPDAVVNFNKKHVAQEYMLLWKLVKEYGDPAKDAKENLVNIRFEEVFPIGKEEHLDKVFLYFQDRCKKVLELAEYAKRIADLEVLAKSGAEVWVINDTLDSYISKYGNAVPLFWETKQAGKESDVAETHIVYVTRDASGVDKLNGYLPGAKGKIAHYPLFFFEDEKQSVSLYSVFPDFKGLTKNDIPIEVDQCKWVSKVEISPLLMLASALLTSAPQGGAATYSGPAAFRVDKFAAVSETNFKDVTTFADIYKQLWYFDDDLAKIFLFNRLRNIAKSGELQPQNPNWKRFFVQDKWGDQIVAFSPLSILEKLVDRNVTPNSLFGYTENETRIGFPIPAPLAAHVIPFDANNLNIFVNEQTQPIVH